VAWGDNQFGQTTVPLTAKSGVVAIAAGDRHSVALKGDGSVVGWGITNISGLTTVPVGLPPIITIAAGSDSTLALVRDLPPSLTLHRNADQTATLSWTGLDTLEQT